MSNNSSHSNHRKALALKRADAEPLTREDIQYDLLCHIFEDYHVVFTDPHITLKGEPSGTKVTFRDLYVNALVKSPRSSKVIRDKVLETPEFGTDFAKISLLANIGRINTTMAFFPEMRTSLRTYHPVPALQKTDGNLQDAPRIKNTLKACLLENESRQPPTTPMDILMRRDAGQSPSTSVVNLIFVMAHHAVSIARSHLAPSVDFLDIFLPGEYSSRSRGNAFLWLCYHFLEPYNTPNPFADDYCRQNPGKAPSLIKLPQSEKENVDPSEELEWGDKMAEQRRNFLLKNAQETKNSTLDVGDTVPPKKEKESRISRQERHNRKKDTSHIDNEGLAYTNSIIDGSILCSGDSSQHSSIHRNVKNIGYQTPEAKSHRSNSPDEPSSRRIVSARHPPTKIRRTSSYHDVVTLPQERTMLQHAWHVVKTTDPLVDSDEENADEHVRLDYLRRLQTLKRLRGKSPTPETEMTHPTLNSNEGSWRPL